MTTVLTFFFVLPIYEFKKMAMWANFSPKKLTGVLDNFLSINRDIFLDINKDKPLRYNMK